MPYHELALATAAKGCFQCVRPTDVELPPDDDSGGRLSRPLDQVSARLFVDALLERPEHVGKLLVEYNEFDTLNALQYMANS